MEGQKREDTQTASKALISLLQFFFLNKEIKLKRGRYLLCRVCFPVVFSDDCTAAPSYILNRSLGGGGIQQ
jgi:hypothetical protein